MHKIILFGIGILFYSSIIFASKEIPSIYINPVTDKNSVTDITSEQIAASGAASLSQVLAANPEVTLLDYYGDGSRAAISMRGFGDNASANTLILVDGVPLISPDLGMVNLNFMPLAAIQQVEVFPGSNSVLYGDQAVGGVVNIITKRPEKRNRSAFFSYGSFDAQNATAMLSDQFTNGLGYSVDASHFFTHNYRDHNANQVNNASVLLNYKMLSGNYYVRYRKINQHLELPGPLTWAEVQRNPRQATIGDSFNNQDTDYWQLGAKNSINHDWSWQLDFLGQTMHGIGLYANYAFAFDEMQREQLLQPKILGVIKLGATPLNTILGGEFLRGTYAMNHNANTESEGSGFAQFTLPYRRQWQIIGGMRYAAVNYDLTSGQTHDSATVTNLELSWQANKYWRAFIRRAASYRFPKVDEEMWTPSGKPLATQRGISYESGIEWHKNNWFSEIMLYQLDLSNEMMTVPVDGRMFNENLDPTRRRGLTLNAAFSPVSNWRFTGAYNFVQATFDAGDYAGKTMPFVARNNWRFTVTYCLANFWQFYLEGIYTGARFPINDFANRELLGGFAAYNFNLSYNQPHYAIALRINNLTNKLYYEYVVTSVLTNVAVYYPAAGISALLTLTVKL